MRYNKKASMGRLFNLIIGLAFIAAGLYIYYFYMPSYYSLNVSINTWNQVVRNMELLTYGSYVLMGIGGIITLKNIWEMF